MHLHEENHISNHSIIFLISSIKHFLLPDIFFLVFDLHMPTL